MPLSAETFTINLYVALASPLIGSGIAAGAARFARGASWDFKPSTCPHCHQRLHLLDLIPVVSWAVLAGRCRGCKRRISVTYPLTELAAVGVAVCAWMATPPAVFAVTCVMGWLLLALSTIDIKTRRLPDILNLMLAITGITATALINPARVLEHLAAAAVGYLMLLAVELAYRRLRGRDGLGRGDSKLFGAIGAWVGLQGLAATLLVAASSAIVFILIWSRMGKVELRGDLVVPFGPFLAIGGWLTWAFGPLVF